MTESDSSQGLQSVFRATGVVVPDPVHELNGGGPITVTALPDGTIHSITTPDVPITLYEGSVLEGGPTNLYLRTLSGGRVLGWTPLLGGADTDVHFSAGGMRVCGRCGQVAYAAVLRLSQESGWEWTVRLWNEAAASVSCDVVYVQDVGMSNAGNEAYISQYVDHTVLERPDQGYVLCARQTMRQRGSYPWLLLGCRQGCRGFVTDGFDFFGCGHRTTRRPAALDQAVLPSVRRQYEFSACVLQSEPMLISVGETVAVDFFAAFDADHPEPTSAADLSRIPAAPATSGAGTDLQAPPLRDRSGTERRPLQSQFVTAPLLQSEDLSAELVSDYWPGGRRHIETDTADTLLSFFTDANAHVVLQAKELVQERPTGAVLRSGTGLVNERGILSVTSYMRGVFVSHLALGNLSFNVALDIRRDPLGILLAGGLRVFVEREGGFELLGEPSAFENGLNGCRWLYVNGDDVIEVTVWAAVDTHAVHLDIRSRVPRRLRLATGIVMGPPGTEPALSEVVEAGERLMMLRPLEGTRFHDRNPGAFVQIVPEEPDKLSRLGGDELLFADSASRGGSSLVMDTVTVDRFRLAFVGALDADTAVPGPEELFAESATFELELARGRDAAAALSGGFALAGADPRIGRLETALPWFVQNAIIHLTAPHGLEQYLGAAWGTRDVCQGPAEMLLAFGREPEVREILLVVFANQHTDGGWSQWFMYDNNSDIRAGDSHGDVVFWPVKALCDYVAATDDVALLDERLPYHGAAGTVETVFEHVGRALDNIRAGFVPDTVLVAYGHGDWNDSLQPADPALAREMVSSWTVGLCYQTLTALQRVCEQAGRAESATELAVLAAEVRRQFKVRLMPDDVVCGFGIVDPILCTEPLLHPGDTRTGIHYRLLPMIRGIISGIFSPDQAHRHADLITRHLLCPDGARLMDRPPRYEGGRQHIFQRGESSPFFGREIGIMYVHAHIRYTQAMARLGRADDVLGGLMAIVPVEIEESVPNAVLRQRNAYFSSSDAAFSDRYQADREYDRVKAGTIGVKGGWRIYSSGPGLVVSLLIRHVLGVRRRGERVVFDPVLAKCLDGLCVDWTLSGTPVRLRFVVAERCFGPTSISVNGSALDTQREENPYRVGGLSVWLTDLSAQLSGGDGNEIVISM